MEIEQQEVTLEDSLSKASHKEANQEKKQIHTCDLCGRTFSFLSSLSQHMRKHTDKKPYKCPHCQHRSAQKGSLKAHIRSHKLESLNQRTGDEEEVEDAGDKEGGVPEEQGGCSSPTESTSACNKVANGEATTKSRKKGVKKERTPSEGGKQCSLCRKRLRSQADLEQHMQVLHDTSKENHLQAEIQKTHYLEEGHAVEEGPSMEEAEKENELEKGEFPCDQCDQVFTQDWFLKAHMKKHQNTLDHGCRICGRRFREPWFLRTHMKTHSTKAKPKSDSEAPATVNEVPQVEASLVNEVCLYELCAKCGNFFHDRKSLKLHEQFHENTEYSTSPAVLSFPVTKRCFLECLNLRVAGEMEKLTEEKLGKRIPELDPVSSYQAWQLATRGRVIEVAEKNFGWEERLADAEVFHDKNKGEHVQVRQEKRKKQLDASFGNANKKRRGIATTGSRSTSATTDHQRNVGQALIGEASAESLSDSEYRPSPRHGRKNSQNKTSECLECGKGFRTQQQMVIHMLIRHGGMSEGINAVSLRDLFPKTKSSTSNPVDSAEGSKDQSQSTRPEVEDENTDSSDHCDFGTSDSSTMAAHVHIQHAAVRDGRQRREALTGQSQTPSTSDKGFPRLRKALLQQPYWSYPSSSHLERAPVSSTASVSNNSDVSGEIKSKRHRKASSDQTDASLINLSINVDNNIGGVPASGSVSHQCPYCAHATLYPEVLWIHQRIAHKIDSTTLVPQWAPKNGIKGPKSLLDFKRRTGPPPFLEGKDCPSLPHTRIVRTTPPESRPAGPNSDKPQTSSSESSYSQSKGLHASGLAHTAKKRTNSHRRDEVKNKMESNQLITSPANRARPAASPQKTRSPNTGSRVAESSLLPQEGLRFMLTNKHSVPAQRQRSPKPQTSHTSSQSEPPAHNSEPSTGFDPWSRISKSKSSSDAQHKKQHTADSSATFTDIYSFLKNCSSNDLAALYRLWGYSSTTMEQTGMVRSGQQEGEYICPVCGKSFGQPSHYRTHMRSHTGERPFQCQYCPYSASQKGNLKTHVQTVHRLTFDNAQYPDRRHHHAASDDPTHPSSPGTSHRTSSS